MLSKNQLDGSVTEMKMFLDVKRHLKQGLLSLLGQFVLPW